MASACSAVDRGHGFGKDEAMKLGDFWGTNKHAVPSKPKHETAYSEQLDAHHRTQLDMAKSLGIEEFLKMASDDLCRQPVTWPFSKSTGANPSRGTREVIGRTSLLKWCSWSCVFRLCWIFAVGSSAHTSGEASERSRRIGGAELLIISGFV